jgi:hypothetical protein
MTSYSNNNFQRSMFGINSVSADSVNTSNLVCDTITINLAGTAPTMDLSDDSDNIATTAFVQGSSATLQSSYDNSINPEIILNVSQGAINIKGDSSTLNIFELENDVGSVTTTIGKNGDIGCNNVNANRVYTDFETPIDTNELTCKNYVDNAVNNILDLDNTWNGENDFSLLPTSSIVPTTNNQLTNKEFVDNAVLNILGSNNTWESTNEFSLIPTCSIVPSLSNELTNKAFVDNAVLNILDLDNTWNGENDFSLLPTSSIVPTTNNQLTNKAFVDNAVLNILDLDNTWTGENNFINSGGINIGSNSSNYVNLNGSGTIISLGYLAGNGKSNCISLGRFAGDENTGGNNICVGNYTSRQGLNIGSINIGSYAGLHETNNTEENRFSINIGHNSAREPKSYSIVLNASGSIFNPQVQSAFYVNPMREVVPSTYMLMAYDTANKEVVHSNALDLVCNSLTTNTIQASSSGSNISLYDNTTTGNITIATAQTTGDIMIGKTPLIYQSSETNINGGFINLLAEQEIILFTQYLGGVGGGTSTKLSLLTGKIKCESKYIELQNNMRMINTQCIPAAYLVNDAGGGVHSKWAIFTTINDFSDFYNSSPGAITKGARRTVNINNIDDYYLIRPGYELIVYQDTNQTGTIRLSYYNNTNYWQAIRPDAGNTSSSCALFYQFVNDNTNQRLQVDAP